MTPCEGGKSHELGADCPRGCHTFCNEAGAQINKACKETVRTIKNHGHEAECHIIEGDNGSGPYVETGNKNTFDDLNIMYTASSPINFVHNQPQTIYIKSKCETEMCLQCGGVPCYWDQLKENFIRTVRENNTPPMD